MRGWCGFGRAVATGLLPLVVLGGAAVAAPAPTGYRIQDLGTFGGPDGCESGVHPTYSSANGVNERGDVVGWAQRSEQLLDPDTGEPLYYPDTGHAVCTLTRHGALWRDGEIIDIGVLPGQPYAYANRLNDHGEVVGIARANADVAHPFLWTEEDGIVDLLAGTPGMFGESWGINNFGEITMTLDSRGYFRDRDGNPRIILLGGANKGSEAWEINDDGIVAAGAIPEDDWRMHAVRYDSAADLAEDIHDPFFAGSYGIGVNPQGDIAATMRYSTGHGFATVRRSTGELVVLPTGNIRYRGELRPDLLIGSVDDVNAHGDVVGTDVSVAPVPPVAWIAFDVFGEGPIEKIPLEDLLSAEDLEVWDTLLFSWEINDARQISGRGIRNGVTRAFLMTPDDSVTPEVAVSRNLRDEFSVGVRQGLRSEFPVPDGVRALPAEFAPPRKIGANGGLSAIRLDTIHAAAGDASVGPRGEDDRFGTIRAKSVPGSDPEDEVETADPRRMDGRDSGTRREADPATGRVGRSDDGRRR